MSNTKNKMTVNKESGLNKALKKVRYFMKRKRADRCISKLLRKKSDHNVISVAFIVQMPEIWDKEAPVFEAMLSDARFSARLIVVPSYDIAKRQISEYGNELEYFVEKYGSECIVKAYEDNDWIDLEQLDLDYVFYQRCWESYLPEQYHTKNVIRFSKTCYIPYAVGLFDGTEYYKKNFFTNLYACFCSTREQTAFHVQNTNRKIVFCGCPVIERYADIAKKLSPSGSKKLLWTPRWTDDAFFGGSTFFENMYNILELKEEHRDIDLVLRPHPMTFPNAVRNGKMTEEEVEEYKNKVKTSGAVFDSNVFIEDSLFSTDILITDYSSIVWEYFIFGKPIIYCTDTDIDFEEVYKKITKVVYKAGNWEEIKKITSMLLSGEDPMYSERIKLVKEIVDENANATKRIIDYIAEDFGLGK